MSSSRPSVRNSASRAPGHQDSANLLHAKLNSARNRSTSGATRNGKRSVPRVSTLYGLHAVNQIWERMKRWPITFVTQRARGYPRLRKPKNSFKMRKPKSLSARMRSGTARSRIASKKDPFNFRGKDFGRDGIQVEQFTQKRAFDGARIDRAQWHLHPHTSLPRWIGLHRKFILPKLLPDSEELIHF